MAAPVLKTPQDYAAEIGRAQQAYQQYGGANRSDLQAGASSYADQIRAAAKSKGVDLSPYGTANSNGMDYTKNYTGGAAGAYDPTKYGQVLANPNQSTTTDAPTGTGTGTGTGTTYTAPTNPNADLINQLYQANLSAQQQAQEKQRQIAQQGLNQQQDVVGQNRIQSLNNNDQMANTNRRIINEKLANQGVQGGDSITANVAQNAAQGTNANTIEQNAGNQFNDIQQKRNIINNNTAGDNAALIAQLNAAKDSAMISNNNTQQQYGLQLAGLTGNINGQQTLQGQNQGFNQNLQTNQFNQAAQQQGFNQNLQTNQFGLQQQNQQFNQNLDTQKIQQAAQQFAQTMGLNYAQLSVQQQNMLGQLAIGQQNANTGAFSAQTGRNAEVSNSQLGQDRLSLDRGNAYGTPDGQGNQSVDYLYKQSLADKNNALGAKYDSQTGQMLNGGPKAVLNGKLAGYATDLDTLTPADRKAALEGEKGKIIKETSIEDYNKLYNTYFDIYGNPK